MNPLPSSLSIGRSFMVGAAFLILLAPVWGIEIPAITWTPKSDWINVTTASAITGGGNATGNGTVDDTAAIQATLTYVQNHQGNSVYHTIYFPAGTYKISSTLLLQSQANTNLVGCGSNTIFQWHGNSGQPMLKTDSTDYIHFTGFVWDGNNLASAGVLHNSSSGGYETRIRHEDESFKNFTVNGTYFYDNNQNSITTCGTGILEGIPYSQVTADSMIYNCKFLNCGAGVQLALQGFQNYMWHIDGCEFESCALGITCYQGSCFEISNSHFQGSTTADIVGGFGMHVRHCTSQGSATFYSEGLSGSPSQDVFQDCWVDGWTSPSAAISLGAVGVSTVFDCSFTHPPAGANPPLHTVLTGSNTILSNNYAPNFGSGTGIFSVQAGGGIPNLRIVPPGGRSPTLTSAAQTFLKTAAITESTHVIDVTASPYLADRLNINDATSAIQSAINAAISANNGSIVFIPPGMYKISSTLLASGGNYSIQGDGPNTLLIWYGAASSSMLQLTNPVGASVKYIRFSPLEAVQTTVAAITATATSAASLVLDDIFYTSSQSGNPGAWGDNPNGPGVVLNGLPAGSTVYAPHLDSTLSVQNCGAAQIYTKFLMMDTVSVSGSTPQTGFLGYTIAEGGQEGNSSSYNITVTDNQDLVIGDYYTETAYNGIDLKRGAGTQTGRVTIQGFNDSGIPNTSTIQVNVENYAGRFFYGAQNISNSYGNASVQVNQSGSNAVDLVFAGDDFVNYAPTFTLDTGANLILARNEIVAGNNLSYLPDAPEPLTYTNYASLAAALDHLRQLEAVDLSVQFGLTPAAAPVAFYPLEKDADDLVGTSNGTSHGETFVDGVAGSYAAQFDGSTQYIDLNNPSPLPSGTAARSIAGWAKANTTAPGFRWIAAYGSPNPDQAMFIGMNGTALYGGGYGDDLIVNDFWDNNWHFIVLTYDGTTAKLYGDGNLLTSGTKNWNLAKSNAFIGKQVNGGEYWSGAIDQVEFYDSVLSAAQVQDLYNRVHANLPLLDGLVAHWRLDETTGDTTADTSGNGITGTWVGEPRFTTSSPGNIQFPNPGSLSNQYGSYVNFGTPSVLPSGTAARTICGWAKCEGLTDGSYGMFASYGSASNGEGFWIGGNGTALSAGSWGDDMPDVSNFWDSNWHFIALTYDGSTAKLYADGQLKESAAKSWDLVPEVCYVGAYLNGFFYWVGAMDDIRIYNRALSASEVLQLANGNP
jgi:hypothetical protein